MGLLNRMRNVLAGPSRAPETAGPAVVETNTQARDDTHHDRHDRHGGSRAPENHGAPPGARG